jgi:ferredoxin
MPKVTVKSVLQEQSFELNDEDSLLVGSEKAMSKAIPVGCRGGGCGLCKIKVLSGEYLRNSMSKAHITEREALQGYALACRIYPLSDLKIEIVEQIDKRKLTRSV